jgi:mannosylglucosylglycerate synthase
MRIAIIHYTAPPTIGGVERVIGWQQRLLESDGHAVDLLVPATLPADLGCYDVVLVHNVFTMPFDLTLTKRLWQTVSTWSHGMWINWVHDIAKINPHYAHLPWQQREYDLLSQPPPNCLHVTVSEVRQKEYATVTGLTAQEVRVMPNAVDVFETLGLSQHMRRCVEQCDLFNRDLVLFHPARMVRRKNIEHALRTVSAIRDAGYDIAYLLTAAPDPHNQDQLIYAAELESLVDELRLRDHVHFIGQQHPLAEQDVRSLYQVADVLLFPSLSEGFGLPLVEAAIHGLPVYCSDIPVHHEVAGADTRFFDLQAEHTGLAVRILNDPLVQTRRTRRAECQKHLRSATPDLLRALVKQAAKK